MSINRSILGSRRRGGIYIAVLGAGMLVTLIGLAAIASMRVARVVAATTADTHQARAHAQSGVELAAQWVASDPLWRTSRTSGMWISDLALDGSIISIEATDPIDGNFLNRPTDPLLIRATAVRGRARQIVESRLDASGTPLDVLSTAIYTPGELRIRPGATLSISGAPAATAGTLHNDGTITGDAECLVSSGTGTISGQVRVVSTPRTLPGSSVVSMYVDLAVPINPGTTIDRRLLAPGVNPWGEASPDGVYVIHSSQDITIRDSRIHGTLVIIAPGRTVTIAGSVLMHSARVDYPALIVDGNLNLQFSRTTDLSEAATGVNFNPPAAPFEGTSNSSTTDAYPSEIRGMVHARGTLAASGQPRIRGALLVESAATSSAVDVQNSLDIVHIPALTSNPPMGYMEAIHMIPRPGSWRQVVLP
jgi:hypothetical protein